MKEARTGTAMRSGTCGGLAVALLLCASVAQAEAPARAQTRAPASASPASVPPASIIAEGTNGLAIPAQIFTVDPQSLAQERARNKVVDSVRDLLGHSGTEVLYAPAATSEMGLREIALEALSRNLDIKRSGLAKTMAERSLIEAQAVFDPVFGVAVNASLTSAFRRIEHPKKFKAETERVAVGNLDTKGLFRCSAAAAALTQGADNGQFCYVITFDNRSAVSALQYDRYRPEGDYPTTVDANKPSLFKPRNDETYTGTLSIVQQLPWGPSLNLSLTSTRRNTYYALNTLNGLGETYGAYYRPYYSNISIGASLPLPYTRDFGPTATADVRRDLARHSIDAAEMEIRAVINSTLYQVETLYWTLVGTLGRMEATAESIKLAQQQRAATQRLFEQGFVTESDKAQVEAQVLRLLTQQQQVFNEYISSSEALRRIIDSHDDALIVPVGYQAVMKMPAGDLSEPDRVFNNPSYLRQSVAVRMASLVREQRDAQTRPNLAMTATLVRSQNTALYGYRDISGSVSRAFTNPDFTSASFSLLYQRPWGNRAAEAALEGAEHGLQQQLLALRKLELSAREDYDTARGNLASARERQRLAARSVTLAKEVYQSAVAQQDAGLVAAYETVSRLTALLNARTTQVQADIDLRLAESRLLAAVGALAERYGERTALTGADRERLALLRGTGTLLHFGGPL